MAAITGIDGNILPGLEIKTVKVLENISNKRMFRTAITSEAMNVVAGVGTQVYRKTQIMAMAPLADSGKTLSTLDPSADYVVLNINIQGGRQIQLPIYDLKRIEAGEGAIVASQWEDRIAQGVSRYLDGALVEFMKNETGSAARMIPLNDNVGNWATYAVGAWTREKRVEEALAFLDNVQLIKETIAASGTADYFGIEDADATIKMIISNKLKPYFSTSYFTLTYAPSAFELFLNGYQDEFMLGTLRTTTTIMLDRQYLDPATNKDNIIGRIMDCRNILGFIYHTEKYAQPVLMNTSITWRMNSNPNIPTINPTFMFGLGVIRPATDLSWVIVRTNAAGVASTWNNSTKAWDLAA